MGGGAVPGDRGTRARSRRGRQSSQDHVWVRGSVRVDPERLRPSDVMVLEGDPSKIHKALGWQTEIPFERTLTDLLQYWRQRVTSTPH